jgi:ABC-type nitrate/sulfonate/bicarbonate transport system ATPase subunit
VADPITIENLGKTYPGGNQALREVSLAVEPGTFLVLLGPSGSGKTTLLRCLAGIERVTSGRITIGERTVADGKGHVPPDQRDLSMVFQDYALWPHLSARDNVAFALRRRHVSRSECRSRAAGMLHRVGLGALADRYPNELSGGEQQRVALARALIADTGLILCDEPLSNLDADLRERMRVEISALVREAAATTVYITHDQAEAFALADQVGVLETRSAGPDRDPGADLHPPGDAVRSPVHRPGRRAAGAGTGPGPGRDRPGRATRRPQFPGPCAARAPHRADRAGHDPPHRGQADLERLGRTSPVRPGHRRGVPRPRVRARHRHQRHHPADRRLLRRPRGPGRDGRPAHGSGRLSPVPGRALEDFCRTERGACCT